MFWWPALLVAADLPECLSGLVARVHDRSGNARVRLHRLRPDGALVPDRKAAPGAACVGLRLHPRLPRAGDSERRQHALLGLERLRGLPATARTDAHPRGPPPFSLETWNNAWFVFIMAILPIGLFVLYRAYAEASIGARRSTGPVVATATFITCTSWIYFYLILTDNFSALSPVSWVLTAGALVAALTALLGLPSRVGCGDPWATSWSRSTGGAGGRARRARRGRWAIRLSSSRCGCRAARLGRRLRAGGRVSERRGPGRDARRRRPRGDHARPRPAEPAGAARGRRERRLASRSRTSDSRRSCARSSASCASRAPGSCAPATRSGAGWSETSTTARSSGSSASGWRCSCSSRGPRGRPTPPSCSTRRAEVQGALRSCASWRAGSTPRS